MDLDLYGLMRLNEKRRMIHDGMPINIEEFNIFDVMEERPPIVDIEPVSYSRERRMDAVERTHPDACVCCEDFGDEPRQS